MPVPLTRVGMCRQFSLIKVNKSVLECVHDVCSLFGMVLVNYFLRDSVLWQYFLPEAEKLAHTHLRALIMF